MLILGQKTSAIMLNLLIILSPDSYFLITFHCLRYTILNSVTSQNPHLNSSFLPAPLHQLQYLSDVPIITIPL
jgi:hypothetical protein